MAVVASVGCAQPGFPWAPPDGELGRDKATAGRERSRGVDRAGFWVSSGGKGVVARTCEQAEREKARGPCCSTLRRHSCQAASQPRRSLGGRATGAYAVHQKPSTDAPTRARRPGAAAHAVASPAPSTFAPRARTRPQARTRPVVAPDPASAHHAHHTAAVRDPTRGLLPKPSSLAYRPSPPVPSLAPSPRTCPVSAAVIEARTLPVPFESGLTRQSLPYSRPLQRPLQPPLQPPLQRRRQHLLQRPRQRSRQRVGSSVRSSAPVVRRPSPSVRRCVRRSSAQNAPPVRVPLELQCPSSASAPRATVPLQWQCLARHNILTSCGGSDLRGSLSWGAQNGWRLGDAVLAAHTEL